MNEDFHYYATYCAARLASYDHETALTIASADAFTDKCTRTFLQKVGGPMSAATTQTQMELMEAETNIAGLQDITRIWSSFHFLPRDLYAEPGRGTKRYKRKYRLLCGPNGQLVKETVELVKGKSPEAIGMAMHVLSDTWAHANFAGTPSLVLNDVNYHIYEVLADGTDRQIVFRHSLSAPDDPEKGLYTASIHQGNENSIMNLGHGRVGHLPDYSYITYRYLPAWGDYDELIKDNPSDYYHAFGQMVEALCYLKGETADFTLETYAEETISPCAEDLRAIFKKRQTDDTEDWKALAGKLFGSELPSFKTSAYEEEYTSADKARKDDTFLGRYFVGALAQKSLVTHHIYASGSKLAGISIDYEASGFKGNRDFRKLVSKKEEDRDHD